MNQVEQHLPAAGSLTALIAALTPIIEEHGFAINEIIKPGLGYTPTNVSADRSFDASATTVGELANVLGTLIQDLQAKGVLT